MSNDVKVVFNPRKLKEVDEKVYKALGLTAKVLQDEVRQAQIVPRYTGNLQNEGFFVDPKTASKGYVRMQFTPPYARRLYFHPEYRFRTDKNPNAQGLWMRPWQKGGAKEKRPAQIFEGLLKRELK